MSFHFGSYFLAQGVQTNNARYHFDTFVGFSLVEASHAEGGAMIS